MKTKIWPAVVCLLLAAWALAYTTVEMQPHVGLSLNIFQLISLSGLILVLAAIFLLMRSLPHTTLLKLLTFIPLVGFVDSVVLTFAHFTSAAAVCPAPLDGQIACDVVNQSIWSEIFGIPVAILGALFYLVLVAVAYTATRNSGKKKSVDYTPHLVGLGVVGLIFTLYLNYIQFYELMTLCALCEVSATTVILFLGGALIAQNQTS